jgi:hypothetical protein
MIEYCVNSVKLAVTTQIWGMPGQRLQEIKLSRLGITRLQYVEFKMSLLNDLTIQAVALLNRGLWTVLETTPQRCLQ